MQTVADMRGVGVKNRGKFADVLCGRPLIGNDIVVFFGHIQMVRFAIEFETHTSASEARASAAVAGRSRSRCCGECSAR